MILTPANYFQLYDDQHAAFQLGVNGDKLTVTEEYLWLNLMLYSRIIKEAGLQGKLQAEYEQTLKNGHSTCLKAYTETVSTKVQDT